MVGIRWLAAIAFAFAACIAAPDASAQTWLRWSKAPAGQPADPSKRIVPTSHPVITVPASVEPDPRAAVPPQMPRGPTVTIIEEAPRIDTIAPRVDPPALPAASTVAEPLPSALTATLAEPAGALPPAASVASPPAPAAVAAAPASAEPPCHDCVTAEELKATSARPARTHIAPDGQKLQSELKRKLLQTR